MKAPWIPPILAAICFCLGAVLFFGADATYEGFELMTAATAAVLCWPALRALFTWRMILLALLIIAPISLIFQCLAVNEGIWVYGPGRYCLGRLHWRRLEMPMMEVVFYFLFPIFQIGLFAAFCRLFPPRPLAAWWSRCFPAILFLAPLSFTAQGLFLQFNPWQGEATNIDWNCAIMGTAFAVTVLTYALSKPYRNFVRSPFFAFWSVGMGGYMFIWEWFHSVLHDHWRYVLNRCLYPPWIIVDSKNGLGLSQAQLYGYFMTSAVFPAIVFLVAGIRKNALRTEAPAYKHLLE